MKKIRYLQVGTTYILARKHKRNFQDIRQFLASKNENR